MSRLGAWRRYLLRCFPRVSGDEPRPPTDPFPGWWGFPRVSGDEPGLTPPADVIIMFSPRERG